MFFYLETLSQRRTQGNPNPRTTANVPPPTVDISTESAPHLVVGTPNSTTIAAPVPTFSTPITTLPENPTLAATLGSSTLVLNSIDYPAIEDFGRDKDLKNLLKNL